MAFGRKVMRGIRRRMAQDRLRRRRLSNIGNRSRTTNARGSASSSERDRLNKLINKKQRAPYTKPTDAELRKGNTGSRVTPVQDRGPRRAVDPIKTGAKRSGQGKGGRGGIPSVKPIKGRGPRMIVDPKRPSTTRAPTPVKGGGTKAIVDPKKPTTGPRIPSVKPIKGKGPRMIVDPKRPSTSVPKHSGEGKGGQGGIPSVKPIKGRGPRMIVDPKRPTTRVRHSGQGKGAGGGLPSLPRPPLQPRQARLANPRGVRPSYSKGGLSATKNAIGPNDYRKTGTTLSVKDNRKKTK